MDIEDIDYVENEELTQEGCPKCGEFLYAIQLSGMSDIKFLLFCKSCGYKEDE